MTTPYKSPRYNQIVEVGFRAGLIGLFSGESQTKALNRTLDQLNAQGFAVASMVVDRWSFWRRLGWLLILILTLGFVGKVPNVLIATEPISARTAEPPAPPAPAALDTAPATPPAVRSPATKARTPRKSVTSTKKVTAPAKKAAKRSPRKSTN